MDEANVARLLVALDNAIASFPAAGCAGLDAILRRECREVALILLHARQRVTDFQRRYRAQAAGGSKGGPSRR